MKRLNCQAALPTKYDQRQNLVLPKWKRPKRRKTRRKRSNERKEKASRELAFLERRRTKAYLRGASRDLVY